MEKQVIEQFTGKQHIYDSGRPYYPETLIEQLHLPKIIADIGSGTGKLTASLLKRGHIVYAVEPNSSMRKKAEENLSHINTFFSVNGSAEKTNLLPNSIDCITVAQAFHWFNPELFQKECRCILKKDGEIVLLWNMRKLENETNKKWYDIFKQFCKTFQGFSSGMKKDDEKIKRFFYQGYKTIIEESPIYVTKEQFIHRSLSSSYSLTKEDKKYNLYIDELENLFEEYQENGYLKIENETIAYIGIV